MIWTEQAISERLDLWLAEAILLDHVSGWPSDQSNEYKISLRHTWAQCPDRPPKRIRTAKKEAKAAYMRGYMVRRRAEQAALRRARA